jgi:hypothetical protein
MIKRMVASVGDGGQFLSMISSAKSAVAKKQEGGEESADNPYVSVGIQVMLKLFDALEADMVKWLASLIGKTPEEFTDLPFDIEICIIEQVANSPMANDFFTAALRLVSATQGFASRFKEKKTA